MKKENLFKIGEAARLFHLSESTIRHYEQAGMVTPEYTDPATGYRYYGPRQFEVFNTVRYLRALDMPLEEIADFLQNRDVGRVEEKLRHQKQVIEEKKRELERIERKIDARLRQLREAQSFVPDEIEQTEAPAFQLFWMDASVRLHHSLDMEIPVGKLAQKQSEAVVFLGKVGVAISAEHLEMEEFTTYDGVFLLLDEADHIDGETLFLPAAPCVRVRFCGGHLQAPQRYRRLMEYLSEHDLCPAGFSREITMIDAGFTDDAEKFVTEITVPVKNKGTPEVPPCID